MIPSSHAKYEPTAVVACANYQSVWGDKQANLDKISRLAREAATRGAGIVAFPELALSGYECSEDFTMHRALAETVPGPVTDRIAALAKEHDIYVTFGMPERDRDDPAICYNSCPLIGPEGHVGTYRKLHIAPPPLFTETRCFTGGDAVPVFETRYGPIGILICADFWVYPELSRILMLKGARVIFNCAGSAEAPDRAYYMEQMTGARATENLVFTASSNLVGRERTIGYYGHSTIAGPSFPRCGGILARGGDREGVITAALNFVELDRYRELFGLERLRRSGVILEEFTRLQEPAAAGQASVHPLGDRAKSA